MIFDWDSSLSFSGDTGPYVQYSCARIASILRKLDTVPTEAPESFPIEHDEEWALLSHIATFSEATQNAVEQRSPAPVATFVLETAHLFTSFYHACPVVTAETDAQREARAAICAATLQTLKNALGLLGIEALERM